MLITRQFGTNWFTMVMGIGIVSALTFTSPISFPFQQPVGIGLFILLNIVFAISLILWITRWVVHTDEALEDFRHPDRVLFYGALAMAINVVGNDYFLIAVHIMPVAIALTISKSIWIVGTVISLLTVLIVPYLLFVEHEVFTEDTLASWLIPVVPPIVAAAAGVNLIPLWGGKEVQFAMTALDIAMFGMTLFLFIMVSSLVYSRLVYHKRIGGAKAPSLWVEIGPIGMSMATLSTLPVKTTAILGAYTPILHTIGMLFSMTMWGIGIWWIILSSMLSILHLTKRGDGIPFNLGWWSYVFPIGSFTSGTYALAHLTQYAAFSIAGFAQLIVLWGFFVVVLVRTFLGAYNGKLIAWRSSHAHLHPVTTATRPVGITRSAYK